jgi:hypothetical protein
MPAVRRLRLEVPLELAMQAFLAHQARHAPMTYGMSSGA